MTSKTQTTTSQQTPVDQAGLQSIYGAVSNAAATPYTPYSGQLVAGINGQQTAGINTINQASNSAQPYYNQAAGLATGAANPLTSAQIQQYQNPYTQDVVNATQAQFNDQNGQQQNSLKGTAAQQGALGGDRQAVAQAQLAGQQNLAQAPVIAGLYSNSYNSGLQTAAQQYQQNPLAASSALSGIGTNVENAGLAGGNAQIQAGTLQQQTQQAQDTANYGQYQAAQAYPYQSAAYLEQYGLPAALAQGTNGTQTAPGPSVLGQIAGLGVAGAGVATKFAADGGRIGYYSGGAPGYVDSKLGYIDSPGGYIPAAHPSGSTSLNHVSFLSPQQASTTPLTSAISGLPSFKSNPLSYGSSVPGSEGPTSVGGAPLNNTGSLGSDPTSIGGVYSHGGLVAAIHGIHKAIRRSRGGAVDGSMPFASFEDGGAPSFDDRFSPAVNSPFGDLSRSQAIDYLAAQNAPTTAPTSIPGGEPTPTRSLSAPPSINPDDPVRMPDAASVQAWRSGVDTPNSAVAADSGIPNPMANPASLPPQITNPDNTAPTTALAYDSTGQNPSPLASQSAPSQPASTSPFHISDKASNALIAAGLGMLASRSPFAGVALGEGGLQGLKSYGEETKAEREEADKVATRAQEQQRIDLQAKSITRQIQDSQRAAASGSLVPGPDGKLVPNKALLDYQQKLEDIKTKENYTPIGNVINGDTIHPLVMDKSSGKIIDAVTQQPPKETDKIEGKGNKPEISDEDAKDMAKYTVATGDQSRLTGLGYTGTNKVKVNHFIEQEKKAQKISDEEYAHRKQDFAATGIGMNAGARTSGTREANLNLILKAADAAIPAALEASEKVSRTGWVPINQIIQRGEVIASNPELKEFGMANLQLAEHWARAMNPTGVMRESDRDKALGFLSTADSKETYKRVVMQLQKQITRERDSIRANPKAPTASTANPGGAAPSEEETKKVGDKTYVRRGDNWFAQ